MRTREDWTRQRDAAQADPGAFHGALAKRQLHWFVPHASGRGAWLTFDETLGLWTGWDATTGAGVQAVVRGRPHQRLLQRGRPLGHVARRRPRAPVEAYPISRRTLLLETARCAMALQALGLKTGDRIALNRPDIPAQLFWTEGAKRMGIVYTPVFGGFSDKTLSDRIRDAGARVVITADGGWRNAQAVPFKTAYTDPALDNDGPATTVREAIAPRLGTLGLAGADAQRVLATVDNTLASEVTVQRSDAMRGVGRALRELGRSSRTDATGLEMIEAVRAPGARCVVATRTDAQREFVQSLGFEDAVAGAVSLEDLQRRLGAQFDWSRTMPRLANARQDIETFRNGVRDFQERTLKPFGAAMGALLRSPDHPRGAPDPVFERAGHDALGVSTALVKPHTAAHQAMWDNRHEGATYEVNHALPALGLRSREALFEAWAAGEQA